MNPPSVALDARMWSHAGIGRYTRELVEAIERVRPETRLRLLGDGRADFIRTRSRVYSLGEQFEIPRLAGDAALLHSPNFNFPLFWKKKLAVTIHDLTYRHDVSAARSRKARAVFTFFLSRLPRHADAVITVSEFTKRDLLEHCPRLKPERVHVIHEAASPVFRSLRDEAFLSAFRRRFNLHRPFILSVGSIRPHKNLPVLIDAVARLREEKGIEHEIILVGKSSPDFSRLNARIDRAPHVRSLGVVDDETLLGLYNLADLFVMPSLREGFGLPLVEAMACGTPVCASDATSIPEILAGAGQLFDPRRVDAVSEAIYNVLKNRDLQKKMTLAGLERAKTFSWDLAAGRTLAVYDELLGRPA